jgi:hypothetical protein
MTAKEYQINKILGYLLGTALFLQAMHIVDRSFAPAKPGSEVALKEGQPAEPKGETAASAQSFDSLLASASAERGAQIAKPCLICRRSSSRFGSGLQLLRRLEGQGRQMDLRRAQQMADQSARRRS